MHNRGRMLLTSPSRAYITYFLTISGSDRHLFTRVSLAAKPIGVGKWREYFNDEMESDRLI